MNLKQKNIGFYLTAAAAVLTLLALVFAIVTGTAQKDLSAWTVVLLVIALVAEGVTLYKDFFAVGTIAASVCSLAGILILVVFRLNKIGLILNGVVDESIPVSFVLAVACVLIAVVCNCIVGFTGTEKRAE